MRFPQMLIRFRLGYWNNLVHKVDPHIDLPRCIEMVRSGESLGTVGRRGSQRTGRLSWSKQVPGVFIGRLVGA